MKDSTGEPEFPIWLIGDSPPEAWADKLDTPLDPRHPARHNIWTAVLDSLQDRLYRQRRLRLDASQLYIRNAISRPLSESTSEEHIRLLKKVFKGLLDKYKPLIVLTFGVDAFRAIVLASGDPHYKLFKTTKNETRLLGEEFRDRIENYNDHKVNIIPLLHTSIARRWFLSAHRDFVGAYGQTPPNYFDYVGAKLADLLLAKLSDKPIWIE
jgi:hypothetical protein